MATLLVATTSGCRVFSKSGEQGTELAGHRVDALAQDRSGTCVAVVDGSSIWSRDPHGSWSHVTAVQHSLQCIAAYNGTVYAGGNDEPVLLHISPGGATQRLSGFDRTPGCETWLANGPPLGVRSLVANGTILVAAVHVGGIPRSLDGGATWSPTIPILHDVHEVCAHPSRPEFLAAAAAVGLCISTDAGEHWTIYGDGNESSSSLAVAILEHEVLYSVQDGPFAKQSQLWRWRLADGHREQVRDGLPVWLDGKVDTHWVAATRDQSAVVDASGHLWWSTTRSTHWEHVATIPPHVFGLILI